MPFFITNLCTIEPSTRPQGCFSLSRFSRAGFCTVCSHATVDEGSIGCRSSQFCKVFVSFGQMCSIYVYWNAGSNPIPLPITEPLLRQREMWNLRNCGGWNFDSDKRRTMKFTSGHLFTRAGVTAFVRDLWKRRRRCNINHPHRSNVYETIIQQGKYRCEVRRRLRRTERPAISWKSVWTVFVAVCCIEAGHSRVREKTAARPPIGSPSTNRIA